MQDHLTEEWRAVVGYEGLYSVSSFGRVRRDAAYRNTWVGRILSTKLRLRGYPGTRLSKNNVAITTTVHRLVTEAFLGPCPDGMQRHHRDGNKENNHATNLEYVTASTNTLHAHHTGLANTRRGEASNTAKLTEGDARTIHASTEPLKQLASHYGVTLRTIRRVQAGETWRHLSNSTPPGAPG